MTAILKNCAGRTLRRYSASTLISIAGCTPSVFRSWCDHQGLFLENRRNGAPERYSLAEIATARAIAVLTGLGVSAQIAIDGAMKALPIFEQLFTFEAGGLDHSLTNIVAIFPSGRSELFAYPRFANESAADGACVIVDAITITGWVMDELEALKPPTLSPPNLERLALEAMAKAWMPPADGAAGEAAGMPPADGRAHELS